MPSLVVLALALLLPVWTARAAEPKPGARGVNIDPLNPWANPKPEAVQGLGITRVRFVYKVDHARILDAVERYTKAGLLVTIVLNNETADLVGASWPAGPSKPRWLLYRANFMRAAADAAWRLRGFGDKVAYQLWNEENLDGSGVPPEEFGPLARQTAAALRLAHPGARIVLGSLLHNGGDVQYLRKALAADSGLIDAVDELGVHVYGGVARQLREISSAYLPFGKPLSVTEWGECGNTPEANAAAMRAALTVLDAAPNIAEGYYFAWSETQSPGCGYGLSDPADAPGQDGELYTLRPAMAGAFRPAGLETWEDEDADARLLFEATYGAGARARWEAEHARDAAEAGWRGADFQNIDDVHRWAIDYRGGK